MRLEDVAAGVRVLGIVPIHPVKIEHTRQMGPDALKVIYEDPTGAVNSAVLYRADIESQLTLVDAEGPGYTADASIWKLAAEALRIKLAGQHDPMLAVTTSDVDPLPHQIQAVYGELLPRTPLRFLLADDPGAGKTIMAGLYIKELMLRGDLARCLIVAPGSLVEQWQDELSEKFGLSFEIFTRDVVASTATGESPFAAHPLLIARMDQLSRNADILADLERSDWDLVVVDEAHRMSASYYGKEFKPTGRYRLGQLLGRVTRHLLLMTATPHAGKEDAFQAFLALLDPDRFEGRFRRQIHDTQTKGVMLRRVKEELRTMAGRPLFPERRASTVPYELSSLEHDLYEAVSQYVRTGMNRAEALKNVDKRRGNTVGFALTVLQRRLASSPEAILRSLERRQARLENRLRESDDVSASPRRGMTRPRFLELGDTESIDDHLDDFSGEDLEEFEEEVVDAATASRTREELRAEIAEVAELARLAKDVRNAGTDVKWTQLDELFNSADVRDPVTGLPRKLIIFTEHRDTLNYLLVKVRAAIGRDDAVVAIHGGIDRNARREVQTRFTNDPSCLILVATDAAGEGLNLQRAHLMVNYDLPWNPNRIEQRFGRIHRIGQREVCHLWNLVATNTREGDVFNQLLTKIDQQRHAYEGKVFDVLGDVFEGRPLRDLLLEAIRHGEKPEVRAYLHKVIDDQISEGLDRLLGERALHHPMLDAALVEKIRLELEEAMARRLQPHYIQAFFAGAFALLGGRLAAREESRYEIPLVPIALRDRRGRSGRVVVSRYQRVCFDRQFIQPDGLLKAELLAPGHPLFDAAVERVLADHQEVLAEGTVLIDRGDPSTGVRLLAAVRDVVVDGAQPPQAVSQRFAYVEQSADGSAVEAEAAYLDYDPPEQGEHDLLRLIEHPWQHSGEADDAIIVWAVTKALPRRLETLRNRITVDVERTRRMTRDRLNHEINHCWTEVQQAQLRIAEGRSVPTRPETLQGRAEDLEHRLEGRMAELDRRLALRSLPPVVGAKALVVGQGLVDQLSGKAPAGYAVDLDAAREVDRRAIETVMSAERTLGRLPEKMPHNNPGYDIRSRTPDGHWVFIEVKGRIAGADEFHVTLREVNTGKNAERYRLALVSVSPEGSEYDQARYLNAPFDGITITDLALTRTSWKWRDKWDEGREPW
ncbi:helicase-related protein [Catenulispora pinisilvae]|uniref:helicase-related protein n=1 Tax=Catenulispora pinisilvae TaxID=2705253 RepID=UPI001890FD48|nr:helicase-related protein [Catenulispora pinisilvae]